MNLEEWRDHSGWMIGMLAILMAFAAIIRQYHSKRPARFVHLAGIALGLAAGGPLFIPALPRLITAVRLMIDARAPTDVSGPFPVATADVTLPASSAFDPAIFVQIWYPAADKTSPAEPKSTIPRLCSEVLAEQHLASARQRFPLILYAPANGGLRDDNASTTAELASHGYVVMAIDDIERASNPQSSAGEIPSPLIFDYSSKDAFERFIQSGDRKVRREAEQALAALDRLTTCANANWRARVRLDQAGFLGFSFGGAVAAEAASFDQRIVAVANLDGALFDHGAAGALKKPYVILLTKDDVFPKLRELHSPEPAKHYFAMMNEKELKKEVRLANQPDGFGFRIRNSYHENLSDQIFTRRFLRTWLFTNPYRVKAIRDSYLLAFFDTYLRGTPSSLLKQSPSPFREVEILKGNQSWLVQAVDELLTASTPN